MPSKKQKTVQWNVFTKSPLHYVGQVLKDKIGSEYILSEAQMGMNLHKLSQAGVAHTPSLNILASESQTSVCHLLNNWEIGMNLAPTFDDAPPDNDGCNNQRADLAAQVLSFYLENSDAEPETALRDLLTNLMHLADRVPWANEYAMGEYFPHELEEAEQNYHAETQPEGETW